MYVFAQTDGQSFVQKIYKFTRKWDNLNCEAYIISKLRECYVDSVPR